MKSPCACRRRRRRWSGCGRSVRFRTTARSRRPMPNWSMTLFGFLMREGKFPTTGSRARSTLADHDDGDIDTLSTRIAHIRTWTFAANRPDWLADPEHWQGITRAVEDKLSDALHERLTERFVDRRTSVLMRRLRENTDAGYRNRQDRRSPGRGPPARPPRRLSLRARCVRRRLRGEGAARAAQKALAGEIDARAGQACRSAATSSSC